MNHPDPLEVPTEQRRPPVAEAVALVDLGLKACRAYEREDLGRRLEGARERLTDPATRVLVVGEFKQGKSSLINALLNAVVCPVDDDIATSVPTVVGFSAEPTATVWHAPIADASATGDTARATAEPIAVELLPEYVTEAGNPDNERRLHMVEVGLPRLLLRQGLQIVDTPGVGGLGSSHNAVTVAALPTADAVLLVTDASQELTASEVRFLRQARELCPTVAVVLTKIDLYPEWRKVMALDRDHLDEQGFADVEVMPVSSALRFHAMKVRDAHINGESGFERLVSYLRDEVVGAGEDLSVRVGANAVLQAARRLSSQFSSEREVLVDPGAVARVQDELMDAQARAERLRSDSARWQTTLNDGIADLNADVDHDLRGRTRQIIAAAEARIDDGDPSEWWDEFETWITQRVAEEVIDNYTLLARRAAELAGTVAEHFMATEADIEVEVEVETPLAVLADLGRPDADMPGVAVGVRRRVGGAAAQGFVAIRGSYGGFMMFRMIGGMVGLGAMNPAVLGVTLLMGGKTLRDEKQRKLSQRRQQAKAAARKYVDEVNFHIGKDSRDTLRRVQRQLRDGFTMRAEELQRTLANKLEAAQQSAQWDDSQRRDRLAAVDAELARVDRLADAARALVSEAASAPTPDPGPPPQVVSP